jgi:V8-like Glu-specific endopeptidase
MNYRLFLLISFLWSFSIWAGNFDSSKAIYGKDNRRFVSSKNSQSLIANISKSVAMIVAKENVEEKFFSSIIKADFINDKDSLNLCLDQKFSGHHSVMSCTGFLVAENILATAGHCFMSSFDCENKKIIFHVLDKNEVSEGYRVAHQNVFNCKNIIKSEIDPSGDRDFALVELDRVVKGVQPLKLSSSNIKLNSNVLMIGHPLGLPQVISTSAKVVDISNENLFKATLDSFAGNSGSPVINENTMEVEGILVSGQDDFESTQNGCMKYKTFSEIMENSNGLTGEGVSRISVITPFLK